MKSNANKQNAEVCPVAFFSLCVKNFQKRPIVKGKRVHLGSGFRTLSKNSLWFAHTRIPKFTSWTDDENVIEIHELTKMENEQT